jgi:hypothetical protein
MLKVDEAVQFATDHFPCGPEALAAHMGLRVHVCPLGKKEGWCIRKKDLAVIRVNSLLSKHRQRFTLAHELSHYLLGTPHQIHRSLADIFRGRNASEVMANKLAAKLLLPEAEVVGSLTRIPLDRHSINVLAKTANISSIVAAIRIAGMPEDLGLVSASVVGFRNGKPAWYPVKAFQGVKRVAEVAMDSLVKARVPVYRGKDDKHDIVAFLLKDGVRTLFIQKLSPEAAAQQTYSEIKRELESYLYENHEGLRSSVEGCLSTFRGRATREPLKLEDAIALFERSYVEKWGAEFNRKIFSLRGREYLRMRLSAWFHP